MHCHILIQNVLSEPMARENWNEMSSKNDVYISRLSSHTKTQTDEWLTQWSCAICNTWCMGSFCKVWSYMCTASNQKFSFCNTSQMLYGHISEAAFYETVQFSISWLTTTTHNLNNAHCFSNIQYFFSISLF